MRLMSFTVTTPQIRARTKTVTRRTGWTFLEVGDRVRAVEKSRGRRPGEPIRSLAILRVTAVSRERLDQITRADVTKEGYPGRSAEWFIRMFCEMNRCDRNVIVTRIAFEYDASMPRSRSPA